MAECTDPALRELLPVLLHPGPGGSGSRQRLEAHVRTCASCRDELQLLTSVRAATTAPPVNAARIAAAVPPYRHSAPAANRGRWLVPTALAASLLLATAVVWNRASVPATPDTTIASAGPATGAELAIGDNLSDLTEADLRALVDELPAMEPTLETEPDPLLPSLDGGSGGEGDL